MIKPDTENIIFDLGGVIIDLNTSLSFDTLAGFIRGERSGESLLGENVQLFLDFEKGLISSGQFRQGIRELTNNPDISDAQVDEAWNRMLLDIPRQRLEVLDRLKPKYELFVLSNTNAIHVPAFNRIVERVSGKPDIGYYFKTVYFSHEIHHRKPEPAIYRHVLEDSELTAEKTLFVDDRLENIEAARALGMQVFHVSPGRDITEFFAGA
jgi:putative hydrolase of the HAD superfamily